MAVPVITHMHAHTRTHARTHAHMHTHTQWELYVMCMGNIFQNTVSITDSYCLVHAGEWDECIKPYMSF